MKAIGFLTLCVAATIAPALAQTPPMTVPLANKHLAGVVESIDTVNGETRLVVKDNDGYDDDVTIASDARTRPAGSQLTVGARVLLTGYNAGNYFDATAVAIVGDGAPEPSAPSYSAQAAPPPPAQNQLPSYAVPGPAYPSYAYAAPYPVYYPAYVPAPVYYGYPVAIGIGFGFYGGYRGPGYFVRGGYGYGHPYGYRR